MFWFVHGIFVFSLPLFLGMGELARPFGDGTVPLVGPDGLPTPSLGLHPERAPMGCRVLGRDRPGDQPRGLLLPELHRTRRVPDHVAAAPRSWRRTSGVITLHLAIIFGTC